jgi:6-phosphogluconolactonase
MPRRVLASAEAVADAALVRVISAAAEAIAARGRFDLALSGGRTPAALYRRLASLDPGRVDWTRTHVWFADERAVPPADPESNFRLVRETLIDPAGIPEANVHRMRGEAGDLAAAAAEYERLLPDPLDLVVLGIGEDGHTASLFPGSPLLEAAAGAARVAAVLDSPKPPPRRLTLTPVALGEARAALMLATGVDKAAAVARALAAAGPVSECPARLVRGREWLLDFDAARGLTE